MTWPFDLLTNNFRIQIIHSDPKRCWHADAYKWIKLWFCFLARNSRSRISIQSILGKRMKVSHFTSAKNHTNQERSWRRMGFWNMTTDHSVNPFNKRDAASEKHELDGRSIDLVFFSTYRWVSTTSREEWVDDVSWKVKLSDIHWPLVVLTLNNWLFHLSFINMFCKSYFLLLNQNIDPEANIETIWVHRGTVRWNKKWINDGRVISTICSNRTQMHRMICPLQFHYTEHFNNTISQMFTKVAAGHVNICPAFDIDHSDARIDKGMWRHRGWKMQTVNCVAFLAS